MKGSEIPVSLTDFFAVVKKLFNWMWLTLTCQKWDNIGVFLIRKGNEASLK